MRTPVEKMMGEMLLLAKLQPNQFYCRLYCFPLGLMTDKPSLDGFFLLFWPTKIPFNTDSHERPDETKLGAFTYSSIFLQGSITRI